MRALAVLAIALLVFAGLWLVDTEALLRLSAICIEGGCGIAPRWLALAGAVVVGAGAVALWRRSRRPAGRRPKGESGRRRSGGKPGKAKAGTAKSAARRATARARPRSAKGAAR